MVKHLTTLKLGVLLIWHNPILNLTTTNSSIRGVEETILSSVESSIAFFELGFLILVVERIVIRRKLRTNEYIRSITTTEPSRVVSNRLSIFPKRMASLKDESAALEALLTDL